MANEKLVVAALAGMSTRTLVGGVLVALAGFLSVPGCGPKTPSADKVREDNVFEIIWGVRNTRGAFNEVPANYLDLAKRHFGAPLDPVRHQPYEYRATGDVVVVCAQFDSASPGWDGKTNAAKYGDPVTHSFGTWTHGPGRQCLTRNVAP
jgi:hypothetical protein